MAQNDSAFDTVIPETTADPSAALPPMDAWGGDPFQALSQGLTALPSPLPDDPAGKKEPANVADKVVKNELSDAIRQTQTSSERAAEEVQKSNERQQGNFLEDNWENLLVAIAGTALQMVGVHNRNPSLMLGGNFLTNLGGSRVNQWDQAYRQERSALITGARESSSTSVRARGQAEAMLMELATRWDMSLDEAYKDPDKKGQIDSLINAPGQTDEDKEYLRNNLKNYAPGRKTPKEIIETRVGEETIGSLDDATAAQTSEMVKIIMSQENTKGLEGDRLKQHIRDQVKFHKQKDLSIPGAEPRYGKVDEETVVNMIMGGEGTMSQAEVETAGGSALLPTREKKKIAADLGWAEEDMHKMIPVDRSKATTVPIFADQFSGISKTIAGGSDELTGSEVISNAVKGAASTGRWIKSEGGFIFQIPTTIEPMGDILGSGGYMSSMNPQMRLKERMSGWQTISPEPYDTKPENMEREIWFWLNDDKVAPEGKYAFYSQINTLLGRM